MLGLFSEFCIKSPDLQAATAVLLDLTLCIRCRNILGELRLFIPDPHFIAESELGQLQVHNTLISDARTLISKRILKSQIVSTSRLGMGVKETLSFLLL